MFWLHACSIADVVSAIHMHDISMHLRRLYVTIKLLLGVTFVAYVLNVIYVKKSTF